MRFGSDLAAMDGLALFDSELASFTEAAFMVVNHVFHLCPDNGYFFHYELFFLHREKLLCFVYCVLSCPLCQ